MASCLERNKHPNLTPPHPHLTPNPCCAPSLTLQSMMASPFVRPFLSEVRGWEQKLSLIGACVG